MPDDRLAISVAEPPAPGSSPAGGLSPALESPASPGASRQLWSYRLVRPLVRPLIGTGITPNHLTTLRLLTGVAACAALAVGAPRWTLWGGVLWILSLLLDYADGELARLGHMATPFGHAYDYAVDTLVNVLFFAAMGMGLRGSQVGAWAISMGLVSAGSVWVTSLLAEALERRLPPGGKAMEGWGGFAPEDLLYLVAPLAWANALLPLLCGATLGAPIAMAVIGWRLWRARPAIR